MLPEFTGLDGMITDCFASYDEDGSGYLEGAQIRVLIDDICREEEVVTFDELAFERLLTVFDHNGDRRIEAPELKPMFQHLLQAISKQKSLRAKKD
jgi:Ca2+-binding EF-hand superfamily protein